MMNSRFRVAFNIVSAGAAPLRPAKQSFLKSVYDISLMICYHWLFVAISLDMFFKNHILEATKNLRYIFGMAMLTWMHFILRFRRRKIQHLISLTDNFTWEELPIRDATGRLTMAGFIPVLDIFMKSVCIGLSVYHILQSGVRILATHEFVFDTWYPFDVTKSPAYEIIIFTQFFGSVLIVTISSGFQGIYAKLVCIACSQLDKLKANLLDINRKHATSRRAVGNGSAEERPSKETAEEDYDAMQKQLNDCIRHHQMIKQFMQCMEDTLSYALCGLFLIFLVALCVIAFSAVLSLNDFTDLSQAIVIYCVLMTNVFVFCWLGNELSTYAESVKEAAFGCDWVGAPVPFQRCLVFIIASTNSDFSLTAGKFVSVSNKTMMKIINQTLSFFMFLLHMKGKSEENQVLKENHHHQHP